MRSHVLPGTGCLLLILALSVPAAAAKDVRVSPTTAPADGAPLTPEESAVLSRALNFDAVAPATPTPARSFGVASLAQPPDPHVSRNEHADGSSTVAVAQRLSSDWNAKVGVDVAAAPATTYEPDKPLPSAAKDKPSGGAWASLGVTRFATIDARVDPGSEQGKLGATIAHSVPLGDHMSVKLHSRYAVSDTVAPASTRDGAATAPVVSSDQSVKLGIGATGSTLSASVSANSTDPEVHDTLSADQKVYGPLHVTTAITDAGRPKSSKSVTAAFKLTW